MKTLHKIFIGTGLATCVLGVGFAVSYGVYQDKCPQIVKAAEYDDDSYTIILNADELNNYTYNNLNNYLITLTSGPAVFSQTSTYNDLVYRVNEIFISNEHAGFNGYVIEQNDYGLSIGYNNDGLADFNDNKFHIAYEDYNEEGYLVIEFSDNLNLVVNSTYYSDVKNAIELDIAANNPQYSYFDFLTEAISLLVGGIVPTASGIGGGLSTLVNALAISNNGMSPFAAIIFIFGGIALALGLSRWVVNLISSLGQRNR